MKWERRWHPLRREWVVIAAHRQTRPWSGETFEAADETRPAWVEGCYLCPRNARIHGTLNPDYEAVFVFDNDHPCVGDEAPDVEAGDDLFRRETARGLARVICYDPRHDMRLARLPASRADALLACFQAQIRECREREEIEGILVFENDGEAVGVSNPHPHGQVYGLGFHPADFARELAACEAHLERTGRALMDEIVERELEEDVRVVERNEGAVAFVPFFARFAYETYIVPRTPAQSLADLDATERAAVASLWHDLSVRFDALWGRPFPNIMTLHEPPTDGRAHPAWRSFLGFAPPLRAPGLKKHLAGPEVGAGTFIADTWPEEKAAELRAAVAGPPSDEP